MENDQNEEMEPWRVAITGSSGLIGSQLRTFLGTAGHQIHRVVRSSPDDERNIYWQPSDNEIEAAKFEGMDVVIHLAGENLFGRWTESKKQAILDSRTRGTELVAGALAELDDPPKVFVSASAVGYYGDTGDRIVDESAAPGDTFIAEVVRRWEEAAAPAAQSGIRTVHPRMGVVLSPQGGALGKMLPPFKLGVGGRIGAGDQYLSWVGVQDVLRAFHFLIVHNELEGPVNVTSPRPVTNGEFTQTLGEVLNRPTVLPLPGALVKLGAGQMGEEMLLQGQRAVPRKLEEAGFDFRFPDLETALRHELGK